MPDITLLLNLLTQFAWLGNWLFFTLAFVESAPFIGVFIPGATLISIGGFLASQDYLNAWDIIFFATIGGIVGDFFSYSLGRWGGNFIKNKKIINQKILDHGEKFFRRYGNKSIFLGRFFGPIRAIIPFIAGLSKMKPKPFIFWNVLSGIGWAILNVFLGYFSGSLVVSIFKKWTSGLTLILVAVTIIVLVYWLIKKRGESLVSSFRASSLNFVQYLHNQNWFKKLIARFTFITDFFNERKHAEEKLFGSVIIFSFLIIIYLLILILDVF
ncbi:MAG: DedA family protein [Candidatus Paceibacterota bacterium]